MLRGGQWAFVDGVFKLIRCWRIPCQGSVDGHWRRAANPTIITFTRTPVLEIASNDHAAWVVLDCVRRTPLLVSFCKLSWLHRVLCAGTSIQLTANNLYRMSVAFFPPSAEILSNMCRQGFDDALRYLKKNSEYCVITVIAAGSWVWMINLNFAVAERKDSYDESKTGLACSSSHWRRHSVYFSNGLICGHIILSCGIFMTTLYLLKAMKLSCSCIWNCWYRSTRYVALVRGRTTSILYNSETIQDGRKYE